MTEPVEEPTQTTTANPPTNEELAREILLLQRQALIAAAKQAAKVLKLEEDLLQLCLEKESVRDTSVKHGSSVLQSGINLTKFRIADGPMFTGPYREIEPFLTWVSSVNTFFFTKDVVEDYDRIALIGNLIKETNLQNFWTTGMKDFIRGSWDDFLRQLFQAALPPDWQEQLTERVQYLKMGTNEDFQAYSTRGRSLQSILNFEETIIDDLSFARFLSHGMPAVLKEEIHVWKLLRPTPFNYFVFEADCNSLYRSLVAKGHIGKQTQAPPRTTHPSSSHPSTTPSNQPRLSPDEFLWKVLSYLESQGLCHFCRTHCGSEHGKCTGTRSRTKVVFPVGYQAPPKPNNYIPPKARLVTTAPSTAGRPTHPPAGRPSRVNVAATAFPEFDDATIAAFAAIDEELARDGELSDGEGSRCVDQPVITPTVIVELTPHGKTVRALADAGSEVNLMSNRLAEELHLRRRKLVKPTRVGLAITSSGDRPELTEFVVDHLKHAPLNSTFQWTYMKLADLGASYDIILGSPFLCHHQFSVSCSKQAMISEISSCQP